jgi:SAM-dependent methyltransferase
LPTERTLAHLRRLYDEGPDPWGHHSRSYERRKFDRTLAAIARLRVATALEVGCGTGALTGRLARHCERVVGVDCIPAALRAAERHLAATRNVELLSGEAPDGLPDCRPDLVVLSEVLYYLETCEITRLAGWIRDHAAEDATILCVNWTGETGQTLSGGEAVTAFAAACRTARRTLEYPGFRIDLFKVARTARC